MRDTDRHAVIPEGDGTSEMREERYHVDGDSADTSRNYDNINQF